MRSFRTVLLALPLLAVATASAQIDVTALGQNGWHSDDTRADGSGLVAAGLNLVSDTLTDDPEASAVGTSAHDADILGQISFQPAPGTVPAGTWPGSMRLFIDAVGGANGKSQVSHRKNDGIGHAPGSILGPGFQAEYSWMGNGPTTVTMSLKFGVKTADFASTGVSGRTGENDWDKILIYEPGQGNGKIADGLWHTETITHTSGKWWFFDRHAGASSQGTPVTFADMATSPIVLSPGKTLADVYALITAPGAHITSIQFGIGSNNPNGNVYVNQLTTNAYLGGQLVTFGPPPPFLTASYAVGAEPRDVALFDLDGDLHADVVTADAGADTVTIRANDGAGAFPSSTTVALGAGDRPVSIAAGDLVAGGGQDLVVAAESAGRIAILSNDPIGTFTETASLTLSGATRPLDVAVGDLGGSATDDFVVAFAGELLIAGTGSVAVSIDGGALTALPAPLAGFQRPQRVALGDLDGDGDLDVACAMGGNAFSSGSDLLLWENLGGSFATPLVKTGFPMNPRALAIGDLDGDSDLDLLLATDDFDPPHFAAWHWVVSNDGLTAGSWNIGAVLAPYAWEDGVIASDLVIADLDDDTIPGFVHRPDALASYFGSGDVLRHFFGVGTPVPPSSVATGNAPSALAVAHLDGDRTLDFAVVNAADGTVTIGRSYTPSLAQTFGVGCPGTGGLVPSISAVGTPSLGNAAFGVALANARPFSPALMALSLGQFTLPLGAGCNLYLELPAVLVATITNGFGGALVPVPLPPAGPDVLGLPAYFQFAVFDPAGAALGGGMSVSDALRIKLGL